MSLLKTYYFELYHHDVEPIVTSSNLWGVQGEYVTESEHVGYTNWVSDNGELQSVIPSGTDVAMFINTDYNVVLDVDVTAHTVVIGAEATLSLNGNRAMAIVESFTLNGLMTVTGNRSLINAADTALLLNGAGTLNLSGNGSNGSLGTEESRNTFAIGESLTVTTQGYSTGYIYANLTNAGTITTASGYLMLSGNTVENTGSIVTGGNTIELKNATVSGAGILNGANGEILLNGAAVNDATFTGYARTGGNNASTLNQITVDENGTLDIQASSIAQGTITINGKVSVLSGKSLYNASAEAVTLAGTGKLNLSGNGSSGNLGSEEKRNAFIIGKDLTVTTLGYSSGAIYANLTNNGTITTEEGTLTLNGSTLANAGSVVTGGNKSITLKDTVVSGSGSLNGKDGTVYLNNSTLTGSVLKGQVQASDGKSTVQNVSVDADGTFTLTADVTAQDTMTVNGTVSVLRSSHLANEMTDTTVTLAGSGILSLSGDGSSGYLGTNENRNGFAIGKSLTVTTLGYSSGSIYANLNNAGTITTTSGYLILSGNTVENTGSIVTGGNTIELQSATVTGIGTLNGASGDIVFNGTAVNNATLTGTLRTTGDTASTFNQVTVDENGALTLHAHAIAQGTVTIDGRVTVQGNSHLANETTDTTVTLAGSGILSLSGDGSSGYLGTNENRNGFAIGKSLTVTTLGYSSGSIYANLNNAGTITTTSGYLILSGNTVENTGSIVTGGNTIELQSATVTGIGTLNGASGDIVFNGTAVNNATLTGTLRTAGNTASTFNQVTVDKNGALTLHAHAIAQGTITIDGRVTVQSSSHLANETEGKVVTLAGSGKLSLSADGSSGSLGTEEYRNAFVIGETLSVTTIGYSSGAIYANLTNNGTITTEAGALTLNGNTVENAGTIITGGKSITLKDADVSGKGSLNGKNGTVYLNNSTLTDSLLKGEVQASDGKSTVKNVTVDTDGTFTMTADVAAQDSIAVNGTVSVLSSSHLVNETADKVVTLTGNGILNLSGNGSSGNLGTDKIRNAFVIGENLSVTTLGYSAGCIYANLTNNGTITTAAGYLKLNGSTVENAGSIVTGGNTIELQNATVNGAGTLNGASGEILLNGAAVNKGVMTGYLRTTGDTASTFNQVTVDENGTLDIRANAIAQGTVTIDGRVTVQGSGNLLNGSADAAVTLAGTGILNLSGNGSSGSLGSEENRKGFTIGKGLTVTTLGYSNGYIYANLTNAGTITTEAGALVVNGSTIENTGAIITGGNKNITLKDADVSGSGMLNGSKGAVYVNGTSLAGSVLKGQVQTTGNKSTLKNITVDVDGKFTLAADAAAQGAVTINGMVSVLSNSHLVNETAGSVVKLNGIGTLNLSGNGSSGHLGGNDAAGGFELGGDLTLTTLGYSSGKICANVKNNGLITTFQGTLNIADCTIDNLGEIRTGGKGISASGTTIKGAGVLDGANGTISLANSVLDGASLKGTVQSQAGTALNGITVTDEGVLEVTGESTTAGIRADGVISVTRNAKLLSSGDGEVLLTGTGTINLSGNGSSGYLGSSASKFNIGQGLTVTTLGYSTGYISGNVTNRGTITTGAGDLKIAGTKDAPATFRNAGTILGGNKAVTLAGTTLDNTGGSIVGGASAVYITDGTTVTGGELGGRLQISGEGTAVVLDENSCIRDGKITVTSKASLSANGILAQGNIYVDRGASLELSNAALAGTVDVSGNPGQVSMSGVSGVFELILNAGYASNYVIVGNDFSSAVLKINGGGSIDLSGNYWGGLTDADEIREKYGLADNISIGEVLAEVPDGGSLFLIGTELANEKYLALAHEDGLKLSFLSELDPESITGESVQLWDDETNEQISLADRLPAVQGKQLIFDNDLFEDGRSYRVVLSDAVRSTDGSVLDTNFRDSVEFTVDRTAPKVLNIEKTVNLTGKLPDFRITFSSEIDISTLSQALKVTSPDGQNIGVQVSPLTEGVALVTSQTAINVPGEYTVSIDADKLTDKAGNHLQESFEGSIGMTRINLDIMDLSASRESVKQGESFNVQWQTFNQEEADLYGKWTDGVYLSKDNIWDNSDTLLASVIHYNGLEQGTSVAGQARVTLSGVVDGDYYLLVRPDIYNDKPTGTSERNVKSVAVSVSTDALPEGEQKISSGQSATYKFTATGGSSYQLLLDTLRDDYNGMELYVGYGYAPTRENYDTAVRNANDAQLALVSQNYDQDVYVMLYARNSGSNIGYTLTTEKVGLNITSVTPGLQAVQPEQALTFVVEGLCFTPDTAVIAVGADEQTVSGAVTYVSDHQLLLTFEPGQLQAGDYVLKATDGESSALSETVTLTADGTPNLEVTADLPQKIGNHYITSFDVNYANTGTASMGAILLTVNIYEVDKDGNKTRSVGIMGVNKSVDQNHRAYNGSYSALPSGYVSTAAIYAQGKVPGQLEPGAGGSVTIDLVGLLQPWNTSGNNNLLWEINYFDENTEEVLNWRELMPGNSDEFYPAMENMVGTTWGDYVKMLQTNAMTLQSVGADASNATDLLQLTVQTVSGTLNPFVTVENVTDLSVATIGSLDLSIIRFYSNHMDDRGWHTNWEYSLVKEDNDAVTFFSPEAGVYTFRRDAYGKYFCENNTGMTLQFKGGQAILQSSADERTWTMDQVDANNWRLSKVGDTHGNSIQLSYDKDGSLSKLASSDGEFILVTKDGVTGSNGVSVTYQYSDNGHLTGVSYGGERNPLAYEYDGDALTGVYRGGQMVSAYVYDANGSVIQATQGNLVTNVTVEQPGVITVTDNCDHDLTSVYYADGSLAKLTDNVSGSWVCFTYDSNGYTQTVTDSSGLGESYVYDANGNLLRYTDAYGSTSVYTYFQGHLKTAENADGYAVNISYDQDWNITEFICSDGAVVTFGYDENGNLSQIVDPLGNVMSYEYDDSRRISTVAYGDYSFTLTYDNLGNIASVTQNEHTTYYEYNTVGRLTSLTDPNGNQAKMTYDGNANLTEAVFADGSSQSWTYDAAGDLASFTTREGDVIPCAWSADGLLTATAVGGVRYEYSYTNGGLLTSVTDVNSVRSLAFEYNTNGNLTGVAYRDGTTISVDRDSSGRIASYTIGGQTFAYTWQGGKMGSVSVNGTEFTSYTRNAKGNLTGGNGIAYQYDAKSNIVKVGGTEYTYNVLSQVVTKSAAEGVWTYFYDLDGRLSGEKLGDGSAVRYTYTYDAAGNRLTKRDEVSGVTTTWTYGEMNQVLTVKAGNAEAIEYTYDRNGNLLSDGRASYTWTPDSRMASMTVDGTTWTYTYNALGYRETASNGTDTYTFYYDGSGNLLAQYKNGAAYQFYIKGATGIEGYIDAEGAVYTFTYDLGGNVTAVSGSNGKSATYTYDAFGSIIAQTGDITDNVLTWHGHFGTLLNPDGTYYVLARNYSAADGRFISTDPTWFNDGANLYTYAYNDPVNYLDLDGMKGDPTSLPTKHEDGSCLDIIAHPEKIFSGLNDWLNHQDLTSNLPTGGPEIGSGHAPEWWFNGMESLIEDNMPDGCDSVGDYYTQAIETAKTLYEKGAISTKDGTVWPSRYSVETVTDQQMSDYYNGYRDATTQHEKEKYIQRAWRRYRQLKEEEKANNSKPNGGTNATTNNSQSASSHDPNDKLATEGVTDLHFVQDGSRLQFTVLFENDPENATAPARRVYVRDVMDENLDLDTFRLHSFTLAGYTYQLPDGRDSFNDRIVLELDDARITVEVAINLDYETRELVASFMAIDPETGFELQDLTKGVLLVNDESGRGEGNFNYSIQTVADLPTDTQIRNTAEIFFDFNDPIETPTTLNTIDATAPDAPASLLATVKGQTVTLSWTGGADQHSGVKEYVVAYSHDGQEFAANTTETSFVIENADYATWNWSVQAVDAVGNVSEVTTGEDFTVTQAVTVRPVKSDIDGNGISDVMFVWTGEHGEGNYQHGYWMNGTSTWQSQNGGHPAEWENLGCYDMTGDGKADSVLVGNVVVNEVKGAYIGFYADAIDAADGSTWTNIGYLNNADDIDWKNKVGSLTGNEKGANSIVWYAPELYALGAWTDGTDSWTTISNSFGGSDWTLVGCGDFDGDGKDSVVMSGLGGMYFYTADLDGTVASMGSANWSGWTVRAIGDFLGDGKDDIVLFHKEYGSMILLADGNLDDFKSIGQLDANDWFVVGAGDYNGDEKDDLLVRQYSTGMLGYYANGDTTNWNVLGYGVGMEWTVIA